MTGYWNQLKNKFETIFWFIKHPQHASFFASLVVRRLFVHPKEGTSEQAIKWCNEKAQNTENYLRSQGISSVEPINTLYPDEFEYATEKQSTSPHQMGGMANLELIYYLSRKIDAAKIIETGVAYGWSSLALLLAAKQSEKEAGLYSSDMPYPKMNNEDFVGCVVPENLRKNWNLIRLPDASALKKIFGLQKTFDLCHYDSDKSYAGRMKTYPLLWNHLRPGGYFISDDIGDNVAFKEFVESINESCDVVFYPEEDKYVGIIKKK